MGRSTVIPLARACMVAVLCCLPAALTAQQLPRPTVLTNARIIIGDGRVLEQGAIRFSGGEIEAVGTMSEVSLSGAEIEDLGGKTLMPAMIDAHAHLGYQSPSGWGSDFYSVENLQQNLDQYAWYGFSAVFSAGSDPDDLAIRFQREQEEGTRGGARFLFAAGVAPPGQGPNNRFLEHTAAVESRTGMTVLRGVSDRRTAIAAVNEIAGKGIKFIKIWVDDRAGSQEKLAPGVYRPLMERAGNLGIPVFVHQQYATDMDDLLAAGAAGFLHGRLGTGFDGDLSSRIAAAGAFIVPNLGLGELRREAIGLDPFLAAVIPVAVAQRLAESPGRQPAEQLAYDDSELVDSMAQMRRHGVEVVLGTDAGAVPDHPFGYTGHRELEIYVRLGMSPAQSLVAATGAAARHLGLDDLGTLEKGKSADFIVLTENPLENIRNTRTIEAVYLSGVRLDREAMREAWQQD